MEIIRLSAIERFLKKNAAARSPITDWIEKTEAAAWKDLTQLKNTFNSADYKKPYTIFDIGGNNYRILTEVIYAAQTVTIIKIGTHQEYERWKL